MHNRDDTMFASNIMPTNIATPRDTKSKQRKTSKANTVSLNPFRHLFVGSYNLLVTNLFSSIVTVFLAFIAFAILCASFVLVALNGVVYESASYDQVTLSMLGMITIFFFIALVVGSFFGFTITRLVVTGSRRQPAGLAESMLLVKNRIWVTLFASFMVFGAIIASGMAFSFIISFVQDRGAVSIIVGLLLAASTLVLSLRYGFIPLILIDNDEPSGLINAFRRGRQLWMRSGGALVLYAAVVFSMLVGVSSLLPNSKNEDTLNPTSISSFSVSIEEEPLTEDTGSEAAGSNIEVTRLVFALLVMALFHFSLFAGLAHIYNESADLIDAKVAGDDMQGPAVVANKDPTPEPSS